MSKYEEFQEWLNQCPIKITEYQDNVTSFAIDFEIVDEDAEEVEQCIIDGNDYKAVSYTHLTLPTTPYV